MKVVINVPDDWEGSRGYPTLEEFEEIFANGTPLPKGHGRLIDADKLKSAFIKWSKAVQGSFTDSDVACIVHNSPTIIEADVEGRITDGKEMIKAYCQHDEKAVSDFRERMASQECQKLN